MSYTIQANPKGSRSMSIEESHLQTIQHYALFSDLLDSNGIVDENVLNKLKLNVKALLERTEGDSNLLSLCKDVIFHDNMKAFGLHQLICLFLEWNKDQEKEEPSVEEN